MTDWYLFGTYQRAFRQRMMHDNGIDTLLQEQTVGGVPVLFPEQWQHFQSKGPGPFPPWEPGFPFGPQPRTFVRLRGRFVEQVFPGINYVENDGAKPVDTTDITRAWRFFLADQCDDFSAREEDVRSSGVTLEQVVEEAKVPAALR